MIYIFLFIPLLLFMFTSYTLNIRKIVDGKLYIILLSLLEAILSFIIIVLFFNQGYLPKFLFWFLLFCTVLFGFLIFFFVHRDDSEQWDIQLETIKNNILIFLKTLLPLYFFLIMFRFWNPILQILTAIIFTFILNLIAKFIRGLLAEPVKMFFRNLGMSSILKALWIWVVIIVIVVFNIFFQFPINATKSFLNLNDDAPYLVYDEMPVDIQNNLNQKNIFSIELPNDLEGDIQDYYYDDNYIYLYSLRSELLVISTNTSDVVFQTQIEGVVAQNDANVFKYDEYYQYFVEEDDILILFDTYGIYEVTESNVTKVLTISSNYSKHYSVDGILHLVEKVDAFNFNIYQYNNGIFTLSETINVNEKSYNNLVVISDELFEVTDSSLILHSDSLVNFLYKENYENVYDSENKIMYYSIFLNAIANPQEVSETKTIYEKVTVSGEVSNITLNDKHSTKMVVYNDGIFVSGLDSFEIIGENFEFTTFFNHIKLQSFLKSNKFRTTNYTQFSIIDEDNIEFLQEQRSNNKISIQINLLVEEKNPLSLPFYTHYGFLTIIPILFGCIFQLTDYKKSIYILSSKTQINNKKEG